MTRQTEVFLIECRVARLIQELAAYNYPRYAECIVALEALRGWLMVIRDPASRLVRKTL